MCPVIWARIRCRQEPNRLPRRMGHLGGCWAPWSLPALPSLRLERAGGFGAGNRNRHLRHINLLEIEAELVLAPSSLSKSPLRSSTGEIPILPISPSWPSSRGPGAVHGRSSVLRADRSMTAGIVWMTSGDCGSAPPPSDAPPVTYPLLSTHGGYPRPFPVIVGAYQ